VRGLGVLLMVFLHAALSQYGGLMQMDRLHPPLVATLVGFLLMWGGLFAVLSGATHAIRSVDRLRQGVPVQTIRHWELLSGAGFVVLGIVYFALVGPTLIDLAAGSSEYSMLVALVRTGVTRAPGLGRVLYMNTLFMVGFSTLLVAPLFAWLAGRRDPSSPVFFAAIAVAAIAVLALSWLRIPMYPWFEQAMREDNYGLAFALFWLVNKNDPVLPSLGLTLLGTLIGLILVSPRPQIRRLLASGTAVALLIAGIVGWAWGPETMLQRTIDETWYSITLMQAGVLLGGILLIHGWLDANRPPRAHAGLVERVFARFSQASLSVLFAETVLSECVGRTLGLIAPNWNRTLTAAIVFGIAMAAVWALILAAWARREYRWSVDRAWVRAMSLCGRPSTKFADGAPGGAIDHGCASGHR
jgi:hypothetical protein